MHCRGSVLSGSSNVKGQARRRAETSSRRFPTGRGRKVHRMSARYPIIRYRSILEPPVTRTSQAATRLRPAVPEVRKFSARRCGSAESTEAIGNQRASSSGGAVAPSVCLFPGQVVDRTDGSKHRRPRHRRLTTHRRNFQHGRNVPTPCSVLTPRRRDRRYGLVSTDANRRDFLDHAESSCAAVCKGFGRDDDRAAPELACCS